MAKKPYVRYHWSLQQRLAYYSAPATANSCIIWTGARSANGYGHLSWCGKRDYAHRFAYTASRGPIPSGLSVLHRCDNPPCVNPDHLFLGTQAANMADMVAKGRKRTKLSTAEVLAIRADTRTDRKIAAEYGIARSLVSRIRRGEARTHV